MRVDPKDIDEADLAVALAAHADRYQGTGEAVDIDAYLAKINLCIERDAPQWARIEGMKLAAKLVKSKGIADPNDPTKRFEVTHSTWRMILEEEGIDVFVPSDISIATGGNKTEPDYVVHDVEALPETKKAEIERKRAELPPN